MKFNRILSALLVFFGTITLASCEPVLPIDPAGITIIAPESTAIELTRTLQLNYELTPIGAEANVIWQSSDPFVATVSAGGLVTSVAIGSFRIAVDVIGYEGMFDAIDLHIVPYQDPTSLSFDFLAVNDFHGSLEENSTEPGIAKLATAIKTERAKNPNRTYLTSTGDMWQGSADSNITRGTLVTEIMNDLNFDSMTLGNHEFDWTTEWIHRNKQAANFPFLACNIKDKAASLAAGKDIFTTELSDPYKLIVNETSGVSIGIIGAIGKGITSSIVASAVKNYEFVDPTPLIAKHSAELRALGADIIIFSYHHGAAADLLSRPAIAEYVDAIFVAHTHLEETGMLTYGSHSAPYIQGQSNGKKLSKVRLNYDTVNREVSVGSYYNIDIIGGKYEADAATQRTYDYFYENEIKTIKESKVSYSSSTVNTTTILNFTLDQMLRKYHTLDSKVIAAVHNGGGVRSSIPSGDITYGDVYKALPFDNNLYIVDYAKNSAAVNLLIAGDFKGQFIDGYSKSNLYAGNGYKVVTISYCFEKYEDYESLDYEILADYPRDIVADALRGGATF